MLHTGSDPLGNRLLGSLPDRDHQRLLAACERVNLRHADVLFEAGEVIDYAYFPTGAIISLVAPMDSGAALEVGLVGDEGMLGIPLLVTEGTSSMRAVVQGSGEALRIDAKELRRLIGLSQQMIQLLGRYLYVMMGHFAQAAACCRFHVLEQRLARRLLMMQDRTYSSVFHITQEFLAYMLGVRRVGITRAATTLKRRGLIRYNRGNITIVDRAGLESACCECYEIDKQRYASTML